MRSSRRFLWSCTIAAGLAASVTAIDACGARTSLDAPATCASSDIAPNDDAAIVVPPIAFVPRSSMVTGISSSTRVVLISSSPNACDDFNALTFNDGGRAPADFRFLDITFANAATDAAYQGLYTVPSSPVGGNKYAVALALKICEGTPFVSGRLSWFAVGDAAVQAAGTVNIEDYVEGQYARGTYDLEFADGGTHVVGSFDAPWCQ